MPRAHYRSRRKFVQITTHLIHRRVSFVIVGPPRLFIFDKHDVSQVPFSAAHRIASRRVMACTRRCDLIGPAVAVSLARYRPGVGA
jgi:hypothetical protein